MILHMHQQNLSIIVLSIDTGTIDASVLALAQTTAVCSFEPQQIETLIDQTIIK